MQADIVKFFRFFSIARLLTRPRSVKAFSMNTFLLISVATFLLLNSCAPVTPQQRIENNVGAYNSLPPGHQELVKRGELARGMSPDAVFLAWGPPSRRYQGLQDNAATERWDYEGFKPIYTNSFGMGYGFGTGYNGRRARYSSLFVSPEVAYVPYRNATVLFKNNRADSWERAQ
jgi:hypothetical protein